jgi:hypothetical protein
VERSRHVSHFSTAQETILYQAITHDLIIFHKKYYRPTSCSPSPVTSTQGDAAAGAGHSWLGASLEVLPSPSQPHPKPGHPVTKRRQPCRVSIGHLGITRHNPDHYAVQMLSSILGGGAFTSRITSRVRSDEGLAYSAASTMTPGVWYDGTFRAFFQSKSATCAQAAAIVLEEIQRIRKDKVTPEELSTAVNYAVEVFPRFFATPAIVAGTFAADEYTRRPADYWPPCDRVVPTGLRWPRSICNPTAHHPGGRQRRRILKGDFTEPQYSFRSSADDGSPPDPDHGVSAVATGSAVRVVTPAATNESYSGVPGGQQHHRSAPSVVGGDLHRAPSSAHRYSGWSRPGVTSSDSSPASETPDHRPVRPAVVPWIASTARRPAAASGDHLPSRITPQRRYSATSRAASSMSSSLHSVIRCISTHGPPNIPLRRLTLLTSPSPR